MVLCLWTCAREPQSCREKSLPNWHRKWCAATEEARTFVWVLRELLSYFYASYKTSRYLDSLAKPFFTKTTSSRVFFQVGKHLRGETKAKERCWQSIWRNGQSWWPLLLSPSKPSPLIRSAHTHGNRCRKSRTAPSHALDIRRLFTPCAPASRLPARI